MEKSNGVGKSLPRDADVTSIHEGETVFNTKEHKLYRSIIGSLLYLAICSRPDIAFSLAVLARHVHAPTKHHMELAKRILRYVAGTVDYSLKYPRSEKLSLESLNVDVDADWGGYRETRKSISGCIIAINGTPIVWTTRKLSCTMYARRKETAWLSSQYTAHGFRI